MPELPEVETVRRGIEPYVTQQRITDVVLREPRLRWRVDRKLPEQLRGRRVLAAQRRAKYLVLPLDSGDRLLIHLGMTGRLNVFTPQQALKKHDHLDIGLSNGKLLRYNDARRFGAVVLWKSTDASHPLLENLGPEPFSAEFDGQYLFERSRGRSAAIKNFIMDGHIVVGAGNIYASEALFRSGLRPTRPAGKLTLTQYKAIAKNVKEVLAEAVEQGGTTLRDFISADGHPGYFQTKLFVYDRAGQPCLRCKTPIRRVVIGQRSSFYCPKCQP